MRIGTTVWLCRSLSWLLHDKPNVTLLCMSIAIRPSLVSIPHGKQTSRRYGSPSSTVSEHVTMDIQHPGVISTDATW